MLIIVAALGIIRLIIDSAHHIRCREPPAVVLGIPDRLDLAIIKKRIDFLLIIIIGLQLCEIL